MNDARVLRGSERSLRLFYRFKHSQDAHAFAARDVVNPDSLKTLYRPFSKVRKPKIASHPHGHSWNFWQGRYGRRHGFDKLIAGGHGIFVEEAKELLQNVHSAKPSDDRSGSW